MLFPPMLFNFAVMAAIAYILLAGFLFFAQSHLIYFPDYARDIAITPCDAGLAYEVCWKFPRSMVKLCMAGLYRRLSQAEQCCFFMAMPGTFPIACNTCRCSTALATIRLFSITVATGIAAERLRSPALISRCGGGVGLSYARTKHTSRPHHIVRRIPWRRDRGVACRAGKTRPARYLLPHLPPCLTWQQNFIHSCLCGCCPASNTIRWNP